jgi:excisionase family DNA binding protein
MKFNISQYNIFMPELPENKMNAQCKTPQDLSEGLLTVKEAAKIAKICPMSVYNAMNRRGLPYIKIGASRRIARAELFRFLQGHGVTIGA